jgi:glutamine amidotransferase
MQVGKQRLPHMGWNEVRSLAPNPLFKGIESGAHFYFVHSFAVSTYEHTLAECIYEHPFSAAIHKDNFYGVQFHPERSSDAGAQLLTNFLNL